MADLKEINRNRNRVFSSPEPTLNLNRNEPTEPNLLNRTLNLSK